MQRYAFLRSRFVTRIWIYNIDYYPLTTLSRNTSLRRFEGANAGWLLRSLISISLRQGNWFFTSSAQCGHECSGLKPQALDNDDLKPTTGPRRVVALGIFFSDTTQMSTFVIGVGTGINYGVAIDCRSSKQLIADSRIGPLKQTLCSRALLTHA